MLYAVEHTEDMNSTWTVDLLPGRRYRKLVRVTAGGREVLAFLEPATGQWYEAKSWTQRGRFANTEASAEYAELAARAQR